MWLYSKQQIDDHNLNSSVSPTQKGITIFSRVVPCTLSAVHFQESMKGIRIQLIIEEVPLFGLNFTLSAPSTYTNPYSPWPSKDFYRYLFWTYYTLIKFDIYIFEVLPLWSFATRMTVAKYP